MWEPRCLTTLWAFMACYRDSFTFSRHIDMWALCTVDHSTFRNRLMVLDALWVKKHFHHHLPYLVVPELHCSWWWWQLPNILFWFSVSQYVPAGSCLSAIVSLYFVLSQNFVKLSCIISVVEEPQIYIFNCSVMARKFPLNFIYVVHQKASHCPQYVQ
jgi:hypothetical protein